LLGHDARPARTASEALSLVDSYDPDVIVLDLGLPDSTGYDVARNIRSRNTRQPFIAAMTGWNAAEDRVHSLAAGIDLHVVKPACAENLERIIDAAKQKLSARGAANPT
jgi:DNA-binding response OmpR family regulator